MKDIPVRNYLMNQFVAYFVAFAGAIWFFFQSIYYAKFQPTILDEGNYLVKGLLFVTGQYTPFQVNGPYTNQMPFSYLIPGYVETIFGAGLRTGRYLSIAFGLLMLLGLWILGKRLGNLWWAAGMVWIIAINPAFSRVYSLAVSQVLIACLFTWILVLVLDDPNRRWRFFLGGAMAGLMVLTRINSAPVLPFLALFVFWHFGWKSGLLSLVSGLVVVVIGHALYWPNILQSWAGWVPGNISPFLDPWRFYNTGSGVWNPPVSFGNRLDSLADGLRTNFVPMLVLTGLGVLILQPKRWNNQFYYRTAVFLTVIASFMVLIHGWVSLANNYCVYCFSGYLMFFSPIILLLLILGSKSWQPGPAKWYSVFVSILVLLLSTLAGFGASQEIGQELADIPIPLVLTGSLRYGSIPLWGVLENAAGISVKTSRWLIPATLGSLIGVAGILVTLFFFWKFNPKKLSISHQFGSVVLAFFLISGVILSPTRILSASGEWIPCRVNMLDSMEKTGAYLSSIISEGSLIYWLGSESSVPLLYISNGRIFPAQLNGKYSYREGGNPDALLKFGLWNQELSDQWRDQADFIIILEDNYDQGWKEYLEAGNFIEYPRSPSINPCIDNQRLRIFQRSSE